DLDSVNWSVISNALIKNELAVMDSKKKLKLKSLFWEEVNELGEFKGKLFDDLVENIQQSLLSEEKVDNRKGIYKNADLLKMHAYKDAIRRTGGAYVLYPGEASIKRQGFHEVIPGLGAFAVRPSKTDSGISELRNFILEVIAHFVNRASQREKIAYRTYDIYKTPPASDDAVEEALPEPYGENRDLLPDETYVLVGYYRSAEQHDWITRTRLYNFRAGTVRGSLVLDKEIVSSKYLLLHTLGETESGDLWRIVSKGPKVFSEDDLTKAGYPRNPSKEDSESKNYLVIEIEPVVDVELKDTRWDFKK